MHTFFYGSQILVWFMHVLIITVSIIYDTSLKLNLRSHNYIYCFTLFACIVSELYLMRVVRYNPGTVALAKADELDDKTVELIDLTQDKDSFMISNEMQNARISADINESIDQSSIPFESTPLPRRRYCEACQIEQPYRTKHCSQCQACIAKFDHHCFWIGGCIGELNLRKFFVMLAVQNITFTWMLAIVS